jgi:glutamyl-tRNA(Gln) amidotransferase subunit E
MPEELAKELETKHSLSPKLASQLVDSDYLSVFEEIVARAKSVAPSFIATILTESLRSLQREQVPVENVREDQLKQAFDLVSKGETAKEEAVEMLSLRMLTKSDLENIISKVVESNQTLVQENGTKALGRMINLVMGEVRGRADPRQVTELLRTRLEQVKP